VLHLVEGGAALTAYGGLMAGLFLCSSFTVTDDFRYCGFSARRDTKKDGTPAGGSCSAFNDT